MTLLLIHLASTWVMVGVIWLVQLLVYPQFTRFDRGTFTQAHQTHMRVMGVLLPPVMIVELVTGIMLLARHPAGIEPLAAWLGLALLMVNWLSTFLIQVPQHKQLATGLDETVIRNLIRGNWIRTVAWTARGGVVLWMLTVATTGH